MNAVISVDRLTKSFGDVRALDALSLEIPQGGVYGILGPNGAGKSTFFRILLGLVHPTGGSGSMLGFPISHTETLRRIGSMIETPRYPAYLTARDSLLWLATAHGQVGSIDMDHWIRRVGLADAADRPVRGFSVGMMQRLGVAAALMNRPDLVILDEPTSGMDPPGIHEMRSVIRDLAENDGVTVILASHQLLEVQRICDRVAILNRGKLAAEGKVSDLTGATEYLHLEASPLLRVKAIVGEAAEIVGDAVLVNIRREDTAALIRHLVSNDIDIMEARWVGGDLEAVFMSETLGEPQTQDASNAA
ncbi:MULTISPECIES: ABC transporter ATP-binding protein [unclassified Brevundimonas]|uniref:ABC transporter ATP-binding protein n=1 Tax=unclassified Brevundimonas TaxID=2622653 RepID=UPI0025BAA814|nr:MULTISPECIES: ABC transporter ATP-binding protein [unclassified Brevundimonas]